MGRRIATIAASAAAAIVLTGCASQLDIREGDCSITMVDVDATANTPLLGGVEADGWVLVQRGECANSLVEFYKQVVKDS